MKRFFKLSLIFSLLSLFITTGFLPIFNHVNAQTNVNDNFVSSLEGGTKSIKDHLDDPDKSISHDGTVAYVMNKVVAVLFPVILIVGVLMAMIGLYQVLTSSDGAKLQTGVNQILYGVIGIIIMYSAKYLTTVIFSDLFKGGNGEAMASVDLITNLYDKIGFPFVKIAIYLSLGFLVVLMMVRVFTYITAQDDSTKKKSLGVITWTTVGMLFITAAKQIVESVYGKQQEVIKTGVQNLSGIGTQILNPKEIPIFFTIINWSLGIVSFVLLIMILIQTYKMLTKPDDAETFTALKKTIAYALGGILLIGSAYLLSNLFILN